MKHKTIFLILFLFVICSSIVYAPKIVEQVTSNSDSGFELEAPLVHNIEQNKAYEFEIHIVNKTNGVPIVKDTTCYFHLYKESTGKHIAELTDSIVSHQFDYEFDVSANNFSDIGYYYFKAQCNNSFQGGFVEESFEVTTTGDDEPDYENQYFLYFVLLACSILIAFGFLKDDFTLVSVGGMGIGLLGGYILVNGFSTLTNEVSVGIGIILTLIGSYFFLRPIAEWVMEMLNSMR